MSVIDKEMKKVKFQSFDKVSFSNDIINKKSIRELKKRANSETVTADIDLHDVILAEQRLALEKELFDLTTTSKSKGKSAAIFKLKDSVTGPKKIGQEPTAMLHPDSNELIINREEITKTTLAYCSKLLTNRAPRQGFEEDILMKDLIHAGRMSDPNGPNCELTLEMFHASLEELSRKQRKVPIYPNWG